MFTSGVLTGIRWPFKAPPRTRKLANCALPPAEGRGAAGTPCTVSLSRSPCFGGTAAGALVAGPAGGGCGGGAGGGGGGRAAGGGGPPRGGGAAGGGGSPGGRTSKFPPRGWRAGRGGKKISAST